jgi:hypothetical protein
MRWLEIGIAMAVAGVVIAFQAFAGPWCEPSSVKGVAAIFIGLSFTVYVHLVDSGRKGAGAAHRIVAGLLAATAIAAVLNSPFEGYALALLVGGAWGYFGSYWTRYVRL